MLDLTVMFLLIAIAAGLLGVIGVAGIAIVVAKVCFGIFVILFVASLLKQHPRDI